MSNNNEGTLCAEMSEDEVLDSSFDSDLLFDDEEMNTESWYSPDLLFVERRMLTGEDYRALLAVGVDVNSVDRRRKYQVVGATLTILYGGQVTDLSLSQLVKSLSCSRFVEWLDSTGIECSVSEGNRRVSLDFPKKARVQGKMCDEPLRTKHAEFVETAEGTWALAQSN